MELDLSGAFGAGLDDSRAKRPRVGRTPDELLAPIEADAKSSGAERTVRELLLYAGRPAGNRRAPLCETLRHQAFELDTQYALDAVGVVSIIIESCVDRACGGGRAGARSARESESFCLFWGQGADGVRAATCGSACH